MRPFSFVRVAISAQWDFNFPPELAALANWGCYTKLNSAKTMVPFISRADTIELTASEPVRPKAGLFEMVLSHTGLRHRFTFHSAFVNTELATALLEPGEREVHIIALDPNSIASFLVAGRPRFVVTAVSGRGSLSVSALPRAWRLARRGGIALWLTMTLLGVSLAVFGEISLGALLCAIGALVGGPAARLPASPFLGHEGVSTFKLPLHDSSSSASSSLSAEGARHSGIQR